MNPQPQLKKIRILALLIALVPIAGVAATPVIDWSNE